MKNPELLYKFNFNPIQKFFTSFGTVFLPHPFNNLIKPFNSP